MTAYFIISSGPVYAVVEKFIDKDVAAVNALHSWVKAFKLPVAYHCGKALTFKDGFVPGTSWRLAKRGWVPSKRTLAGKELYKYWEALPVIPSGMDLLLNIIDLSGTRDLMRVNQTGTPGCKMRKKKIYLAIDPYWLPKYRKGIKEITATEYQQA